MQERVDGARIEVASVQVVDAAVVVVVEAVAGVSPGLVQILPCEIRVVEVDAGVEHGGLEDAGATLDVPGVRRLDDVEVARLARVERVVGRVCGLQQVVWLGVDNAGQSPDALRRRANVVSCRQAGPDHVQLGDAALNLDAKAD